METTAIFDLARRAHAEGNLALAEHYLGSILGAEPNHAEALHELGRIAHQQGDLIQAIDYLNRSLIADSSNAETWQHLGDARLAVGNVRDAIANYEQALVLRPDYGDAYHNLGIAWQLVNELETGIEYLRAAIALMPPSALPYNNLGLALKKRGKSAEAVAAFDQAVRQEPNHADAVGNLAITLHENGELDRAVVFYREALRLAPENAQLCNNLGAILKEQGLVEDAIAQFLQTLRIQPDHALAFYNLCELAVEGRYQFPSGELSRIKALVTSEQCRAGDRSLYGFGLGMMLNQQGSYDEAFRYYKLANELRKDLSREQNNGFDAQRHDALVDRIIAIHDRAYFHRVQGCGMDTEQPIFIVGMPRSGSTLVEQILASHPRVFGAGELNELPRLIEKLAAEAGAAVYDRPLLSDPRFAQDLANQFLQCIPSGGKDYARVTIKNLDNYLHLGVIAALFPRARVIHCLRDPFDTCLSCYFQNFYDVIFSWSLEDVGACFRAYEKIMAHWSTALPRAWHELRYEDLIRDLEGTTRKLLHFCGLDWDERCLRFFETCRVVRTASSLQVRKPVSGRSLGRWKNYRAHLEPLFRALGRCPDMPFTGDSRRHSEHSDRHARR